MDCENAGKTVLEARPWIVYELAYAEPRLTAVQARICAPMLNNECVGIRKRFLDMP